MRKNNIQTIEIVIRNKNGESEVAKTFKLTPVENDECHCSCSKCDFYCYEDTLCKIADVSGCGYESKSGKLKVWKEVKE